MGLIPSVPNSELDSLFERAREALAKMSPEQRASMYASQGIGYVASELVMSVYEDRASRSNARVMLRQILEALAGNADAYIRFPLLVERVWTLLPGDKESLRTRIENMVMELDTP